MRRESRTFVRVDVGLPGACNVVDPRGNPTGTIGARVVNLSAGGAYVLVDEPLHVGASVRVRLASFQPILALDPSARVVRVDRIDGRHGAALQFVDHAAEDIVTLTRFVLASARPVGGEGRHGGAAAWAPSRDAATRRVAAAGSAGVKHPSTRRKRRTTILGSSGESAFRVAARARAGAAAGRRGLAAARDSMARDAAAPGDRCRCPGRGGGAGSPARPRHGRLVHAAARPNAGRGDRDRGDEEGDHRPSLGARDVGARLPADPPVDRPDRDDAGVGQWWRQGRRAGHRRHRQPQRARS